MGIRIFIVGYEMECEKSLFSKAGCIGESFAIGMSREFQLLVYQTRPDCTFYPIVIQLS